MITSNRKFGIEIEFFTNSKEKLRELYERIHIVEDGSIRHLKYAGEYVSGILQGKTGESTVRTVCETLKKYGASGDDPATSVHVHLDGMKTTGTLRSSRSNPKIKDRQIAISNKLKEKITPSNIRNILDGDFFHHPIGSRYSNFDSDPTVSYLSLAELTRAPRLNYTYYWIERPDRFKWLRNVFYFYTLFSPVMEDIVSNSRRIGNMFCIPLGKSYELEQIESAKDMNELKKIWYKGRESTGHYDDSRYHNVNLHCYWDRHGTVEIRSHGGTIDADKILLWLKLHQKIVDKLEDVSLDDIKFTSNLNEEFIKFVEEPILQEYVRRLLGYYSGIKVK